MLVKITYVLRVPEDADLSTVLDGANAASNEVENWIEGETGFARLDADETSVEEIEKS